MLKAKLRFQMPTISFCVSFVNCPMSNTESQTTIPNAQNFILCLSPSVCVCVCEFDFDFGKPLRVGGFCSASIQCSPSCTRPSATSCTILATIRTWFHAWTPPRRAWRWLPNAQMLVWSKCQVLKCTNECSNARMNLQMHKWMLKCTNESSNAQVPNARMNLQMLECQMLKCSNAKCPLARNVKCSNAYMNLQTHKCCFQTTYPVLFPKLAFMVAIDADTVFAEDVYVC